MATTNKKFDNEEMGVGWKRETASGESYMNGVWKATRDIKAGEDVAWVAFKNKYKEKENQPDIRFYLSKPKGERSAAPQSAAKPAAPAPAATEEGIF